MQTLCFSWIPAFGLAEKVQEQRFEIATPRSFAFAKQNGGARNDLKTPFVSLQGARP